MGSPPRPEDMSRRSLEMEVANSRVTIAHLMLCTALDPKDQVEWRDRYNDAWAEARRVKESEEVPRG